jgi:DNA ligase-1
MYYVTSDHLKKIFYPTLGNSHIDIFELLDELSSRRLSGHQALYDIARFISENMEFEDVILNIIDKDLKTRANVSIINSVFPKLIPEFSVALAEKYEDKYVDFINDQWFVSRKLDGCRCITIIKDGDIRFYSREGKEFLTLDVLRKEIEKLNIYNYMFDGEICIVNDKGEEDFQSVMKEIGKKNHTIKNPRYFVFDCMLVQDFEIKETVDPFEVRQDILSESLRKYRGTNITQLSQTIVKDSKEFEFWLQEAKNHGWEGIMLRKNEKYKGRRSKDLLKCKEMQDAEYFVEGVEFGDFRIIEDGEERTIETLASIKIKHKGFEVSVGSGFTLDERKHFHECPWDIIGKKVTVQFFSETQAKNGDFSLRFPVFKGIRDYE